MNEAEKKRDPNANVAALARGDQVIGPYIHDAQSNGIWFLENGRGIIEDCSIYKNKLPAIHIDSESNPIILRCKIYDGLQNGISVSNKATGLVEACELADLSELELTQCSEAGVHPRSRFCVPPVDRCTRCRG